MMKHRYLGSFKVWLKRRAAQSSLNDVKCVLKCGFIKVCVQKMHKMGQKPFVSRINGYLGGCHTLMKKVLQRIEPMLQIKERTSIGDNCTTIIVEHRIKPLTYFTCKDQAQQYGYRQLAMAKKDDIKQIWIGWLL